MTASISPTSTCDDHLRYLYARPDREIAVDTETSDVEKGGPLGLRVDDGRAKCIGVSVAYRDDDNVVQSFYVGIDHWVGENADKATVARLSHVLRQPRPLDFANVQFDVLSLLTVGIDIRGCEFYDVQTMANMINENYPIMKSLDNLAEHYLPPGNRKVASWPWEAVFKLKSEKLTGWPNTTPHMMDNYARTDTELTLRVAEVLKGDMRWREIPAEVWKHKQAFTHLLIKMRSRGILIDQKLTRALEKQGTERMAAINASLGLDLNRPSHKETLFLEKLKLPVVKVSDKTGNPSFDKFAMAIYEPMLERMNSPIAKLFKEYQGWKTATTAMYRVYLDRLSPDGRLRTEYTTHVTATGRLSSKNPNLQQIPKDSKKVWNGRTKECFVALPGYTLVNADFSQLELRLATGYAKEAALIETFLRGEDIFTTMTEQFKELLPEDVAADWTRDKQKTLVYSMQYGAGKTRVMNAFGVDEETALLLLKTYRQAFPRFTALNRACTLKAEVDGQIRLWSGRIRHFSYASDGYKAMNSLIQGGAADIVERVMVRLDQELDDDEKCRILLTVHDSVVFEIRDDLVDEYMERIREIMSDVDAVTPDSFGVRFAVDVERWKYTEAA